MTVAALFCALRTALFSGGRNSRADHLDDQDMGIFGQKYLMMPALSCVGFPVLPRAKMGGSPTVDPLKDLDAIASSKWRRAPKFCAQKAGLNPLAK
jgi:hypothetical protein